MIYLLGLPGPTTHVGIGWDPCTTAHLGWIVPSSDVGRFEACVYVVAEVEFCS